MRSKLTSLLGALSWSTWTTDLGWFPWSPQWWGFSGRALGKGKEGRGSWVFLIGSFQARAQQRCWGGRHHVGRRRYQSDSKSLTCGEDSRGKAASCGILSCLQEHCVVCVLWQALQSDPRVLSIHNQLLQRTRIKKAGGGGTINLHYGTVGKLGQQCCLLYPTVRRKLPMGGRGAAPTWGLGLLSHKCTWDKFRYLSYWVSGFRLHWAYCGREAAEEAEP